MNTLYKIAYKNLVYHLKWSIPTALSIILAVGLMSGLGTFISSYIESSRASIVEQSGSSHLVAYNLNEEQIRRLNSFDEVKEIEVIPVASYARIKNYNILNTNRPYLKLVNMSETQFDSNRLTLLEGRLPLTPFEIVLSEDVNFYTNLNFVLGDKVVLNLGNRVYQGAQIYNRFYLRGEQFNFVMEKEYTIVGFFQTPPPSIENYEESGFTSIVIDDTYQPNLNIVTIRLAQPNAGSFQYVSGYLNNQSLSFSRTPLMDTYFTSIQSLEYSPFYFVIAAGVLIGLLIVLASVSVIRNAYAINNRHLINQLGILDSVGATLPQKRWILVIQALLLAAVSIPTGLLFGYMVASFLILTFQNPLNAVYFATGLKVRLSFEIVLFITIVNLFVVLGTSYFTTRKIAELSGIEAIKYYNHDIETGSRKLLPKHFRSFESKMAFINYSRNQKFYRSLSISLIISIILIGTSISLVNSNQRELINSRKDITFVYEKEEIDDGMVLDIVSDLKNSNQFEESGLWDQYYLSASVNPIQVRQDINPEIVANINTLSIQVMDDEYCTYEFNRQQPNFNCETQALFMDSYKTSYLDTNNRVVNVSGSLFYGNETVEFQSEDQVFKIDLMAPHIYYVHAQSEMEPTIFMSESMFRSFSSPLINYVKENVNNKVSVVHEIFVNTAADVNGETIFRRILTENGVQNLNQINNFKNQNLLTVQLTQFFGLISLSMVILIVIIALSNVINSINHSLALRHNEIAILIANGMTIESYIKMIIIEISLFGVTAFVIGIPVSILFSSLISSLLGLRANSLVIHWVLIIAISLFLIAIVMLIAIGISVNSIKNHNITQLTKE